MFHCMHTSYSSGPLEKVKIQVGFFIYSSYKMQMFFDGFYVIERRTSATINIGPCCHFVVVLSFAGLFVLAGLWDKGQRPFLPSLCVFIVYLFVSVFTMQCFSFII